jgi:hypothetical protein
MTIERTEDAILVKLPLDTDEKDLKRFLNYFRYRELTKNSKATQGDADELAKLVNKSMTEKFLNIRKSN